MLRKLHFKKLWFVLGVGLLLLIVVGSLVPVPAPESGILVNDKFIHIAMYFTLMTWFAQVVAEHRRFSLAITFASLGFILEIAQQATGYRSFEWGDVFANFTGVLLGWAAMFTIVGKAIYMMDARLARLIGRRD